MDSDPRIPTVTRVNIDRLFSECLLLIFLPLFLSQFLEKEYLLRRVEPWFLQKLP